MNRMAYLFARKTYPVKEWSEILQEELAGFSWDVQEEKSGRKTVLVYKEQAITVTIHKSKGVSVSVGRQTLTRRNHDMDDIISLISAYSSQRLYPLDYIEKISSSGLKYRTDEGVQFIAFADCARNWAKYFNENLIHQYTRQDGSALEPLEPDGNGCVGVRDWFAVSPYYELYSEPKIRFQMDYKPSFMDRLSRIPKKRIKKIYPVFSNIEKRLNKKGWHTFDMG